MEARSSRNDSMKDFVGLKVGKNFEGHGYFLGQVVSYNSHRKFFKVVYDDGDQEEVDLLELREILLNASQCDETNSGQQTTETFGQTSGRNKSMESDSKRAMDQKHDNKVSIVAQQSPNDKSQSSEVREEIPKVVVVEDKLCHGRTAGNNFDKFVGRTVRKYTCEGDFLGKVLSYHNRPMFTIEYLDGCKEELTLSELQEMLMGKDDIDDISECEGFNGLVQVRNEAGGSKDVPMINKTLVTSQERKKADQISACKAEETTCGRTSESEWVSPQKHGALGFDTKEKLKVQRSTGAKPSLVESFGEIKIVPAAKYSGEKDAIADPDSQMEFKGLLLLHGKVNENGGDQEEINIGLSKQKNHYLVDSCGVIDVRLVDENVSPEQYKLLRNQWKIDGDTTLAKDVFQSESPPVLSTDVSQQALSSHSHSHGKSCYKDLVGRKVQKNFEGFGEFVGKVKSYNAQYKFFRVEYTDGDSEDITIMELRKILMPEEEGMVEVANPKETLMPKRMRK